MGKPTDKVQGLGRLARRLPWEPPRLRYLGNITTLVRGGQPKGPSPFDSDPESALQFPPGQG